MDSKDKLMKDKNLRDATVRRLEIIGEEVKNIPDYFRKKYIDIEWKKLQEQKT